MVWLLPSPARHRGAVQHRRARWTRGERRSGTRSSRAECNDIPATGVVTIRTGSCLLQRRGCSAVGTFGLEDVTHDTAFMEYSSDGVCCPPPSTLGCPNGQQQLTVLPRQQAFSRCDTCQRWHRPTAATMGEGIRCSALIHPSLRKTRKRALQAVEAEANRASGQRGVRFLLPSPSKSSTSNGGETIRCYHQDRSGSHETNGSARSKGG